MTYFGSDRSSIPMFHNWKGALRLRFFMFFRGSYVFFHFFVFPFAGCSCLQVNYGQLGLWMSFLGASKRKARKHVQTPAIKGAIWTKVPFLEVKCIVSYVSSIIFKKNVWWVCRESSLSSRTLCTYLVFFFDVEGITRRLQEGATSGQPLNC